MKINCKYCGEESESMSRRKQFCNDICRGRYRRLHANESGTYFVKCPTCLNVFRTYHNNKKYCSPKCTVFDSSIIPEKTRDIKTVNCEECGKKVSSTHSDRKFCNDKCRNNWKYQHLNQHRAYKYQTGDRDITLKKLIDIHGNICSICNEACDSGDYFKDDNGTIICGDNYPSIDHIVPLVGDGTHEWSNVQLAHRICNSRKNCKPPTELFSLKI